MLGVTLDHGHHGLHAIEGVSLSVCREDRDQVALEQRSPNAPELVCAGQPELPRGLDSHLGGL
jgi:hypothetical protein